MSYVGNFDGIIFVICVFGLRDKYVDMCKYWIQFWYICYGNCYFFNKGMDKNGIYIFLMILVQIGIGQY